jgi:hypothetical protein
MLLCRLVGGLPVMLAAITPSVMRLLRSLEGVVDQLSPLADAPALVSTRIYLPVRLCR